MSRIRDDEPSRTRGAEAAVMTSAGPANGAEEAVMTSAGPANGAEEEVMTRTAGGVRRRGGSDDER